jgi:hypothetical protein
LRLIQRREEPPGGRTAIPRAGQSTTVKPATGQAAAPQELKFVPHRIGTFRSEACGVADFNGDGRLDIIAGPNLYLAPEWKPLKIRTLAGSVDDQGKGYFDDFMNLPLDADGDGKPDVASCGWFSMSVT